MTPSLAHTRSLIPGHSSRGSIAGLAQWLTRSFFLSFFFSFARVYIPDFAQGFRSLSSLSMQMFLKDELGLEPAASQTLLSTAYLPWSCKPIYGLISD